jgi:hypothetical protein
VVFLADFCIFSPIADNLIADNLLPTVPICDKCDVLSIPDNLFAVLIAFSIANDNNSFFAFLAL